MQARQRSGSSPLGTTIRNRVRALVLTVYVRDDPLCHRLLRGAGLDGQGERQPYTPAVQPFCFSFILSYLPAIISSRLPNTTHWVL